MLANLLKYTKQIYSVANLLKYNKQIFSVTCVIRYTWGSGKNVGISRVSKYSFFFLQENAYFFNQKKCIG